MHPLQTQLAQLTSNSGEHNRLTLKNIKGWLKEYLESYAEEVGQHPDEASSSHWDLLVADYDAAEDAHFVAAYFQGDRVIFLSGRGPIPDVRAFSLNDFPDSPNYLLDQLERRFQTGKPVTAVLADVLTWIEGS